MSLCTAITLPAHKRIKCPVDLSASSDDESVEGAVEVDCVYKCFDGVSFSRTLHFYLMTGIDEKESARAMCTFSEKTRCRARGPYFTFRMRAHADIQMRLT